MAQQNINIGTIANDGTGDPLRDAFGKVNSNFTELYSNEKPYSAKTANYTITSSNWTIDCTANSFTVTLPTAVGVTGVYYNIKNSGTGTITIATTSSQTIDGELNQYLTNKDSVTVQSTGTNWIII